LHLTPVNRGDELLTWNVQLDCSAFVSQKRYTAYAYF